MLIDFTVENYRSIKEPVTLSAIAQSRGSVRVMDGTSRRRVKPDNEIAPAYSAEGRDFELLPVLGIFGANASGKSNVVRALDDLLRFMAFGANRERESLRGFVPFRLNRSTINAPTRFELRVALDDFVYTYRLSLDRSRILSEHLEHIPPAPLRTRLLFHREWQSSVGKYVWKNGADFGGPHTQLQALIKEHQPLISLLVDNLDVEVIQMLTTWLGTRPVGISLGVEDIDQEFAAKLCHEKPMFRNQVLDLVRRFDTGISDIDVRASGFEQDKSDDQEYRVIVSHDTADGRILWSLEEESIGTQRLFGLAYRILEALEWNTPLIVDELGSNIHPNITRSIVRLFQKPQTNPGCAQLIFTSHDNTLQRGNLLRRDQIWFTQKRPDGSTELYPLSDFKVRNDLAIDKAYLDGRFGAVPILPSDEELLPTEEAVQK